MRFYVHGAGRAGRAAWPTQSEGDAVFSDHSTVARVVDKVDLVVAQSPEAQTVVAHSLGAVPIALAISTRRLLPSRVILLEPALYDLARGDEAIEHHIVAMMHARQQAESGDLFSFWREFSALMFGSEPVLENWEDQRSTAQKFAAMDTPWGHSTEVRWVADVPTLVLTGAWNQEYEAIAARLAQAGATHRHLGSTHRPQDHPDFESVVADFVS